MAAFLDNSPPMRFFLVATCALLIGCGAKTGLLVPDADVLPDAGMDAGIDAPMCRPEIVNLTRRGAQVVFTVDRSNSMDDTIDGRERPPATDPSRWDLVGRTLGEVLTVADPLLEIGAKFYPGVRVVMTPEDACAVDPGIDIAPARGRIDDLLSIFRTTVPGGGTPTAVALGEVERFFSTRPAPGVPRFIVLATDGGPNCNPDTGVPPTVCLCTGSRADGDCADPTFGPYNCIDDRRTLDIIERLSGELSVPVYVIGIDDPTRPDLGDVLDDMARRGGRPRDALPGERLFYSVARVDDLREALTTITNSISRCIFEVDPVPTLDAIVEITVDGVRIAQDGTRSEGWDFTAPDRSEISLFGGACERVTETGGMVVATILCPP